MGSVYVSKNHRRAKKMRYISDRAISVSLGINIISGIALLVIAYKIIIG